MERARGVGLIPAYAGSTIARLHFMSSPRAHPRLRGEHATENRKYAFPWGSSPPTRGALDHCAVLNLDTGLIPAYAGSTVVVR